MKRRSIARSSWTPFCHGTSHKRNQVQDTAVTYQTLTHDRRIHDVFSAADGSFVEFIAQNRRRCNTGDNQTDNVNRLVPQVTLLQAVSVQRINNAEAAQLAPSVWKSGFNVSTPRYRLASLDEADDDAQETRFICRFRATVIDQDTSKPSTRILGETLSRYPFNYEFLSYRKGMRGLLTPKGKDTAFFWLSTLRFRCPVPDHLQQAIREGHTMLRDGTASVYVDVVPIRTSVRYNEVHFSKDYVRTLRRMQFFDATIGWGPNNVLPLVEASGRWENIPVCPPPQPATIEASKVDKEAIAVAPQKVVKKQHTLSACLWSSAVFKARGVTKSVNSDTLRRIHEWIEFHLLVGFDHIYVYDNSGAHSNETSLAPLLSRYAQQVTRIDWPSTVCNNNNPTDDSSGERSSQYAAEASCLA
jgi:Glycosyltransferase family 92